MQGNTTQRNIAQQLEVTERTVYNWIKTNAWDRLRRSAHAAPAMIAENLCSQLIEMQNAIASREVGSRYPTMQEAETTRKIIASMEKIKKATGMSQQMQVLQTFGNFIKPNVSRDVMYHFNRQTINYFEAEAKNGYLPYDIEYGIHDEPIEPSSTNNETAENPNPATV